MHCNRVIITKLINDIYNMWDVVTINVRLAIIFVPILLLFYTPFSIEFI